MSSTGKIEVELEVKSEAGKFWNSIRDASTFFVKAFPDLYKSIDVLEGDGKSVGSIRQMHYAEGHSVTTGTEKIESLDEEKRSLSYSIIDGDLLKYYKNFKAHITVTPKGEGEEGSKVNYACEFEKASEEIPEPNLILEFAVKNFKELDAYVLTA